MREVLSKFKLIFTAKDNHITLNICSLKWNLPPVTNTQWKNATDRTVDSTYIIMLEGNSLTFNCGKRFKVHENMSCDIKNVIYAMKCRGCGEEYIGEIGNVLRKRITVHNQQIRDPRTRMLKVSEHIDNCSSTLNPKYYVFLFYKMYKEGTTLWRAKEKFFTNTLKPKLDRAS